MRIYDIITKKKRREKLTKEEIEAFVSGYTSGEIPDYQMSALLMAICLNGMDSKETAELTAAIAESGGSVDLSEFGRLSADKHSTGGVGDKTTLIVAPLAAALGCKVAKMSGRGLGHTGGTVDKLESIQGYTTAVSKEDFYRQVREIGIAVVGQTENLAPADKKLYALRDVTATVDSIPLITSSIMGKKLASGAHTIVLDVKCGSGAFMKTPEDAEILAESMVEIGRLCGRATAAVITDMDTPLGYAVGNALEVKEAIDTLKAKGPKDLTEISIALAALMAQLSLDIPQGEAERLAREALKSGAALQKFKEWISAQGGDARVTENADILPKAKYAHEIKATRGGYISKTDAERIGLAAMELGAGRKTKDDIIDYGAGVILNKKRGDRVAVGDTIATLYTDKPEALNSAEELFLSAISISDENTNTTPIIYKIIL